MGFLGRACELRNELAQRYPSTLWRDIDAGSRGLEVVELALGQYESVLNLTGDVTRLWSQVEEALVSCAVLAAVWEARSLGAEPAGAEPAVGGPRVDSVSVDGEKGAAGAVVAGSALREEREPALGTRARGMRVLDVGSGGGFPGLVIAACTVVDLELVEPRAKRVAFLDVALGMIRGATGSVGASSVWRGRVDAGRYQGEGRGPATGSFDSAGARAVFAPSRWLEEARPWLGVRGTVMLHQHSTDALPEDCELVTHVDRGEWSVRAVRLST